MSAAIIYPATYFQEIGEAHAPRNVAGETIDRQECSRAAECGFDRGNPPVSVSQRRHGSSGRRGSLSSVSTPLHEGLNKSHVLESVKREHVRSWTHYDEVQNEVCIVELQLCVRLLHPSPGLEEEDVSEEVDSVVSSAGGGVGGSASLTTADASTSPLLLQQTYEWKIWLLPGRSDNLFPDGGANPVPLRQDELRGCRESSLAKERIREHFGAASPPQGRSPVRLSDTDTDLPESKGKNRAEGRRAPIIASAVFTVASSPQYLDHVDQGTIASNGSFMPSSSFMSSHHISTDSFASSFGFHQSAPRVLKMTGVDSIDLLHENASLYAGLMGVSFLSSREIIVYTATSPQSDKTQQETISLDLFVLSKDQKGDEYNENIVESESVHHQSSSPSGKARWYRFPGLISLPVMRPSSNHEYESPPRLLHFSLLKQDLDADYVDLFYSTACHSSCADKLQSAPHAFDIAAGVVRIHKLREGLVKKGQNDIISTHLEYNVIDEKRDFNRILPQSGNKNSSSSTGNQPTEMLLPWDCVWVLVPTIAEKEDVSISLNPKQPPERGVLPFLHNYRFIGLLPVPSGPSRRFDTTPGIESIVRPGARTPVVLHCFGCSEMGLSDPVGVIKSTTKPFTGVGISLPGTCIWTDPATSPSAILSTARSDEDRLARRLKESRQAVYITSLGSPMKRVQSVLDAEEKKIPSCPSYPAMLEIVLHCSRSETMGVRVCDTGLYISSICWTDLRLKTHTDGSKQVITLPRDQDNTCWNGFSPMRLPRDNAGDPAGSQRVAHMARLRSHSSTLSSWESFASPPYQTLSVVPYPVTIGSMFNSQKTIVCLQKRPVSEEMRILCVTLAYNDAPDHNRAHLLSELTFTPPPPQLIKTTWFPTQSEAASTENVSLEASHAASQNQFSVIQKLVEWVVAVVMETFSKEEREDNDLTYHNRFDEEETDISDYKRKNMPKHTTDCVCPLFTAAVPHATNTRDVSERNEAIGRSPSRAPGNTGCCSVPHVCTRKEPSISAWMAASIMVHSLWRRLLLDGNNESLLRPILHTFSGEEAENRPLMLSLSLLQNPYLEEISSIENMDSESLARVLLRNGLKNLTNVGNPDSHFDESKLLALSRFWRATMEQLLITLDWWSTTNFAVEVMRCVALFFLGMTGVPKEVEEQIRILLKKSVSENQSLGSAAMKSPDERLRHCLRQLSLVSGNGISAVLDTRIFPPSTTNEQQDGNLTFLNLTLLTPTEAVVSRFLLSISGALDGEMHAELAAWKRGVMTSLDSVDRELDAAIAPSPSALLLLYVHRRLGVPLELVLEDFWCAGHPGVSWRQTVPDDEEEEEEEDDQAEMLATQRRSIGHVLLEVVDPQQLWASTKLLMNFPSCTTSSKFINRTYHSTSPFVEYCLSATRGVWRLLGQWPPAVYIEFAVNNLGLGLPAFMSEMLSIFSHENVSELDRCRRWSLSIDAVWQRWVSVVSSTRMNSVATEMERGVEQVLTSFLSVLFQESRYASIELHRSPFFHFFSGSSKSMHSFHILATLHVIYRLLQSVERKHLTPHAERVGRTELSVVSANASSDRPFNEDRWGNEQISDDDWLTRESEAKENDDIPLPPPFVMSNDSPAAKWCESHDAELLKLYKGIAVLRWLSQDDTAFADQIRDSIVAVSEEYKKDFPECKKGLFLCLSSFAELLPSGSSQSLSMDETVSALELAMRSAEKNAVLPPLYEVIHLVMTTSFTEGLFYRLVWMTGLIFEKHKPFWSGKARPGCPLYSGNAGDSKSFISETEDVLALILFLETRGSKKAAQETKGETSSIPLSNLNKNESSGNQLSGDGAQKLSKTTRGTKGRLLSVPMLLLSFWKQLWCNLFVHQPYAATNTLLFTSIRRIIQNQIQLPAPAPLSRVTYIEALLSFCCDSTLIPFFLYTYPTLLSLAEEEMMLTTSSSTSDFPSFSRLNETSGKNLLCQLELAFSSESYPYTNRAALTSNEVLEKFLSELSSILQSTGFLKERGILAPSAGAPLADRRSVRCYECIANTLYRLTKLIPRDGSTASKASPAVAAHQRTSSLSFPSSGSPCHIRTASRSGQRRDEDHAEGKQFPDFYFSPPQAYFFATQLFTHDGAKLFVAGEILRRQLREYILSYLLYHKLLEPALCSGNDQRGGDYWIWFAAAKSSHAKIGNDGGEEIIIHQFPTRLPDVMKLWNVKNYLNDCVDRLESCGNIFARAGEVVGEVYAHSNSGSSLWSRRGNGANLEDESEAEEKRSLSLAVFYDVIQLILFFDVHHSLFLSDSGSEINEVHSMLSHNGDNTLGPRGHSSEEKDTLQRRYWREIGLICVANETVTEMQRLIRKVVFERYSGLSFDQQQILRLLVREEFRPLLFTDVDRPLPAQKSHLMPPDCGSRQSTNSPKVCLIEKGKSSTTAISASVFVDAEEHGIKEFEEVRDYIAAEDERRKPIHGRTESAAITAEHLLGDVALLSSIKQLCKEEAQQRQRLALQLATENKNLWVHNPKDPLCHALSHLYVSHRYTSTFFLNTLLKFAAEQKDIFFTFLMKLQQRLYEEFALERRRLQVHLIEIWQHRISSLRQREQDIREEIEVKWRMGLEHYREYTTQLSDFYWKEYQGRATVIDEWEEGLEELVYEQLEQEDNMDWDDDAEEGADESIIYWREALQNMVSMLPRKPIGFGKVVINGSESVTKNMIAPSQNGGFGQVVGTTFTLSEKHPYPVNTNVIHDSPSCPQHAPNPPKEDELGDPIQSGAAAIAKLGGSVFSAFKNLRSKLEEKVPEVALGLNSEPIAVSHSGEVVLRTPQLVEHMKGKSASMENGEQELHASKANGWSDDDNEFGWDDEIVVPVKATKGVPALRSSEHVRERDLTSSSPLSEAEPKVVALKPSKMKTMKKEDSTKNKDEHKRSSTSAGGSMETSLISSPVSVEVIADGKGLLKASRKKKGLGGVSRVVAVEKPLSEVNWSAVNEEERLPVGMYSAATDTEKLTIGSSAIHQRTDVEEWNQGPSTRLQEVHNKVVLSSVPDATAMVEKTPREKEKKGLDASRDVKAKEEASADNNGFQEEISVSTNLPEGKPTNEFGAPLPTKEVSNEPCQVNSTMMVPNIVLELQEDLVDSTSSHLVEPLPVGTLLSGEQPVGGNDGNQSVPLPQKPIEILNGKLKVDVSRKGTKKSKGLGAKPLRGAGGRSPKRTIASVDMTPTAIEGKGPQAGEEAVIDTDDEDFPLKRVEESVRSPALNFHIPPLEINTAQDHDDSDESKPPFPLPPTVEIPSPPLSTQEGPQGEEKTVLKESPISMNEEDRLLKESVLRLVEDDNRSSQLLGDDATDIVSISTLPLVLQTELDVEVKKKLCSELDTFMDAQEQIRGDVTIAEALERLHLVRRFFLGLTG